MIILYRVLIGGAGIYPNFLIIISAGTIGLILHRYRFERMLSTKNTMNLEFYFFASNNSLSYWNLSDLCFAEKSVY